MWFYLSSREARFCSDLVLWVPSPLHGGVSPQGGGPARLGLADCTGTVVQQTEGLSGREHLPGPFGDEDSGGPLPEPPGQEQAGTWAQP